MPFGRAHTCLGERLLVMRAVRSLLSHSNALAMSTRTAALLWRGYVHSPSPSARPQFLAEGPLFTSTTEVRPLFTATRVLSHASDLTSPPLWLGVRRRGAGQLHRHARGALGIDITR